MEASCSLGAGAARPSDGIAQEEYEDSYVDIPEWCDRLVSMPTLDESAPTTHFCYIPGTPLHGCAAEGRLTLLAHLIERCPAIDTLDFNGNSALHCAAAAGVLPSVQALLRGGADPTIANRTGYTPWQLAQAGSHLAVAALLKAWGANSMRQPVEPPSDPQALPERFEALEARSYVKEEPMGLVEPERWVPQSPAGPHDCPARESDPQPLVQAMSSLTLPPEPSLARAGSPSRDAFYSPEPSKLREVGAPGELSSSSDSSSMSAPGYASGMSIPNASQQSFAEVFAARQFESSEQPRPPSYYKRVQPRSSFASTGSYTPQAVSPAPSPRGHGWKASTLDHMLGSGPPRSPAKPWTGRQTAPGPDAAIVEPRASLSAPEDDFVDSEAMTHLCQVGSDPSLAAMVGGVEAEAEREAAYAAQSAAHAQASRAPNGQHRAPSGPAPPSPLAWQRLEAAAARAPLAPVTQAQKKWSLAAYNASRSGFESSA